MKSLLKSIILFSALYSQALAATTYTTHYSLAKPSDGSTSWGSDIRNNFDTIDTQMYVANNSLANHIADTTGAHAATAISTTVGGSTCTSADDVQEFLDCLDTNFGILIGGNVMTTNTTQTVTGPKTFTQVITGTNGFSLTGGLSLLSYGDGILHTVSGGVTSSSVINADVSASAAIARTKLASGSNNHVIINDGSGVLSSEAQLAVSRGGTGIASGTSGGVPYFSGSTTISSSSALPLNSVIVGGGAGAAPSPLPTGTPYQPLRIPSGGGAPAFGALDISQSSSVTGALPVGNGGIGITSGTSGGIPYFSGSTTIASSSAFPLNSLIVGGGAGAAPSPLPTGTPYQSLRIPSGGGTPAFGAIDISQSAATTGTLPVTSGGTGASTLTANNVILGNGSSAVQFVAPGTSGNVLTSNGSTWSSSAASPGNVSDIYVDRATTQSIPTGVSTTIIFSNQLYAHDISYNTGTGVATINTTGTYHVCANSDIAGSALGIRSIDFVGTGSVSPASANLAFPFPNAGTLISGGCLDFEATATDTFHIEYLQTSGGSLNVGTSGATYIHMSAHRVK